MPDAHANFAYSLVTVAPAPAASGLSLTVADGSVYPTAPFNAVVCPVGVLPLAANAEIIRVTNNAAGVLTILRQQEGTAARSILVGDSLFAAITAKTLTDAELPPQWSKDDATGAITGSADPGTIALTLAQTDENTPLLDLRGAPLSAFNAESLLRVTDVDYDEPIMDIDTGGNVFGYKAASDPDPLHGFILSREGRVILHGNSTTTPGNSAHIQFEWDGLTVFAVQPHGTIFVVNARDPADNAFQVNAAPGQTANIFEAWTDDLRFRLDKDARLVTSVHSAPADADLAAGECSLWFDDTDGAAKLMIKAKSADGTVVAGEVALA